jgi:hypothetical protein
LNDFRIENCWQLLDLPPESLEELRNRQTVWVLGAVERATEWIKAMSEALNVDAGKIGAVKLARLDPEKYKNKDTLLLRFAGAEAGTGKA